MRDKFDHARGWFCKQAVVSAASHTEETTMPTVTLEEAQAELRDLIHNLLHGEELVITENDYPIARLTRSPRTSWPCQPGSAKDKSHWMTEDFDAPLEDFKEYMESTTTR